MCFFSSRKTLAELASLAISVKRGGMKVLVVLDGGVGDGLVGWWVGRCRCGRRVYARERAFHTYRTQTPHAHSR